MKKVIFIFITVLIIAAAGLTACRLFGTPVEDTPENNGITVNKIINDDGHILMAFRLTEEMQLRSPLKYQQLQELHCHLRFIIEGCSIC